MSLRTSAWLLIAAVAIASTARAVAGVDFAASAQAALGRIAVVGADVTAAERAVAGSTPDMVGLVAQRLTLAHSIARAVGQTEWQALRERRGPAADDPAALAPAERRLALECLLLEYDFARRIGSILLAERELARLEPWVKTVESDTWPKLVSEVAGMEYGAESEVPDGEALRGRALEAEPRAELFAEAEKFARQYPDQLTAYYPLLILLRRTGREEELDRAVAGLLRRAPHNRSLRTLASDLRNNVPASQSRR